MASSPQGPADPQKKTTPTALRSVIAGSTAGAIEIGESQDPSEKAFHVLSQYADLATLSLAITYPAECMSSFCSQHRSTNRPVGPWRICSRYSQSISCENSLAAQSSPGRRQEASMAAIRQAVVCRMHYTDHWQFSQGWYPYVLMGLDAMYGFLFFANGCNDQASWPLISTRASLRMRMANCQDPRRFLPALELV